MASETYQAIVDLGRCGQITLVGDLHGKLSALEAILGERQLESALKRGGHTLILLGDLLDRGPVEGERSERFHVGVERLLDRVIDLVDAHPGRIGVIAGNHEVMHLTDITRGGLGAGQVSSWGNEGRLRLTDRRIEFLRRLPLALRFQVGQTRGIALHAGVPERPWLLEELAAGCQDLALLHDRSSAVKPILWSNPSWYPGSAGFPFTRLHVASFLEANGAQVLVRGHHNAPEIREIPGGRRFICVHSAQGDARSDSVEEDGHVYLAWDPPGEPHLVTRAPVRTGQPASWQAKGPQRRFRTSSAG